MENVARHLPSERCFIQREHLCTIELHVTMLLDPLASRIVVHVAATMLASRAWHQSLSCRHAMMRMGDDPVNEQCVVERARSAQPTLVDPLNLAIQRIRSATSLATR